MSKYKIGDRVKVANLNQIEWRAKGFMSSIGIISRLSNSNKTFPYIISFDNEELNKISHNGGTYLWSDDNLTHYNINKRIN